MALSLALCAAILLAAGGLAAYTFLTEPEAERSGATKKTAMLVETVAVDRGDHRPTIVATGTVEPVRDIVLQSQVGGRIVSLAPDFVPGGFVKKGQVLVRLERDDFQHALAQRKSDLRQALSDLAVEKGRQNVARAEFEFLGEDLAGEDEALMLRKPQLEAVEERVRAARAAIEQAELQLRRTTIEAPFDAHILRRDVNIGSLVTSGAPLARMVGLNEYWVAVELPLSKLSQLSFAADSDGEASEVRVYDESSWGQGVYRSGYLSRLVGALDGDTRMARVLATIPDPLARGEANDKPPLMIGQFVEAHVQGEVIEGVVPLNRDYLRDETTVWAMEDGKLEVRQVEVEFKDAERAYISSGLDDDDQVVTTNLSTVVEGAPLRTEAGGGGGGDDAPAQQPPQEGGTE